MNLLSIILQIVNEPISSAPEIMEESYLELILKGGWILLPIFLLSILAIYIIIYKVISLSSVGRFNKRRILKIVELIYDKKIDQATSYAAEYETADLAIINAGLEEFDGNIEDAQEAMEVESRTQLARLESGLTWLAITASVAPMLGFLGTIFGVIKIFYNISLTNDLSIGNISAGLYEKMICSGAGLFVGIIAFVGYSLLNTKIDKIVNKLDWSTNQVLKALRKVNKQKV